MTPELWQRLKPLYEAAIEVPAGERAEFVDEACQSDSELREELQALLAAEDQSANRFDEPVLDLHDIYPARKQAFQEGDVLLGRFRIVRFLDEGGMGEVYEATDLQLGRVALKTIRPDMATRGEQFSRFKREVQLARKVTSPHVCRIHELHIAPITPDASQAAFLTMEFLEGTTLAARIRERGPLPWREAQKVTVEICSGLQCIHETGVIHRDIKGRNIMLTTRNGRPCAVLMDFGIARHLSHHGGETSTALTQRGAIVGTPNYMAPEQFANGEISPATDVYALGIIFHEALTGEHPFPKRAGDGDADRQAGIVRRPITLPSGTPRRFQRVICKCLEYDPKHRYHSAQEVAEAIRGRSALSWIRRRPLATASWVLSSSLLIIGLLQIPAIGDRVRGMLLSSREKHIAVLPLDVVGATPETQAIGDGMMDSLAGRLANLDGADQSLWVAPASEVRARKVADPRAALREFGATIVIKGSFERDKGTTRLKLALIDPKKMREIGFVDVARQNGDLSELQDEAATRLERLINISAQGGPTRDSGEPRPKAAYEDYLEGIGYFQRRDKPGNIDLAIASLQKAVKTDPHFALAFAHLAEVYVMKYRLRPDTQDLQQAEMYAKHADQLDDHIPSTYVALGQIHLLRGERDLARSEFQEAISLDPSNAEALNGIAHSFAKAGMKKEAEEAYQRAAALRPNDWNGYNELGNFYQSVGRPDDAIIQFNRAIALTPDNSWPYVNLGVAYMDDPKMRAEAERLFEKAIAIDPTTYGAYANLAVLYGEQRRFRESAAASESALKLDSHHYDVWDNLTKAYEWLGEDRLADDARKHAIVLLEQAVKVDPENAEAQATLAALSAKSGFRERAEGILKQLVALQSNDEDVLCQMAEAYELLGDRKNAVKYLNLAVSDGLSRLELNEDSELQGVISDPAFRMPGK